MRRLTAQGANCWTKQSVDYNFVGYAACGFFPNEYMTVGKKHAGLVKLFGKSSGYGGFNETDTLNAKTHQMIGESIYFGTKHKSAEQQLLTSYHQVKSAPKVPRTNPVC